MVLFTASRTSPRAVTLFANVWQQQQHHHHRLLSQTLAVVTHASPAIAGTTTRTARRGVHIEKQLADRGIVLPPPSSPRANYNIVCRASGNMLYISGHLPFEADGKTLRTGKIGPGHHSLEYGYEAARLAGLNIIATLKEQLGDLDRVEQVVKVFGIVQSTDDFKEQHKVMDGCSDVMMEVFGNPVGYHARSAIGTSTLPIDISVEVEAIVQVKGN